MKKDARLEIRLPLELREKLKEVAKQLGYTSSELVRKAIEVVIENPSLLEDAKKEATKDDIAIISEKMDTLIRMLEKQERKLQRQKPRKKE